MAHSNSNSNTNSNPNQNKPLAYFIEKNQNLVHIAPHTFIEIACDPNQHISIQACAGSGKTWLLASRILRLLLADVSPQQILALTFTKKAAFEMQERVLAWLNDWQKADDKALKNELSTRGIAETDIDDALLQKARNLYAKLIAQPLYLNISTFDVWFKDLLAQLPIYLLSPIPENLLTETAQYFENLLLTIFLDIKNIKDKEISEFEDLLHIEKAFHQLKIDYRLDDAKIKNIFSELFQKRDTQSEYLKIIKTHKSNEINDFKTDIPSDIILDTEKILALKLDMMDAIRPHISTTKYQNVYQKLEQASDAFEIYQAITVQKKDDILKLDKALSFHARAHEFKNYFLAQKSKALQYTLALLLKKYAQAKQNDGFYDFSDILAQLIHLDADFLEKLPRTHQHQHILLDEFQDTNPTQWAFIKNYLKYLNKKNIDFKLFVVGDDKQAIYRFRGGDVRVMKAPQKLKIKNLELDWQILSTQNTRRCSQTVVEQMNQALSAQNAHGLYPIFIEHSSQHPDLGEAYILELAEDSATEMQQLAQHLLHIKQNYNLRWQDILIVSRARSKWPLLEDALNQAGIPFFAHRKGGLLQAQPICDLLALLQLCLPTADRYHAEIIENSPLQDFITDQRRMQLLRKNSQIQNAPVFLSYILEQSKCYERYPQNHDQFYIQQFFELSLEYAHNHGAFYSVAQFLQDVQKHIYSRFSSETPSALLPSFNAVEINTIHGVKGLEAKWVVLIDANAPFDFQADMLHDWPIESAYPKASYIGHKDLYAALCPHLLEEEKTQQIQGYYNLLYVAITRAKYGFIATGSQYRGKIAENSWFDLLSRKWQCLKNSDIQVQTEIYQNSVYNLNQDLNLEKFQSTKQCLFYDFSIPTNHHPFTTTFDEVFDDVSDHVLPTFSENILNHELDEKLDKKLNEKLNEELNEKLDILGDAENIKNIEQKQAIQQDSQAQIFGKLAHFILQALGERPQQKIYHKHLEKHPLILSYLKSIREKFNNQEEMNLLYEKAWQTVEKLIHMPHLEKIFAPEASAIILCEYELPAAIENQGLITSTSISTSTSGSNLAPLLRIDRLIITEQEILIIDYKFGELLEKNLKSQAKSMQNYQQQLEKYQAAVMQALPSSTPPQAYLLFKTGELKKFSD